MALMGAAYRLGAGVDSIGWLLTLLGPGGGDDCCGRLAGTVGCEAEDLAAVQPVAGP